MMVSTKGRYALRIMIDIAIHSQGQYLSLRDVAERQEISMKYLESIVSSLSRAQLLESLRGKHGGYRLAAPIERYTLGQILKATEGTMAPVACLANDVLCERADNCTTLPVWKGLDEVIDQYLESITLLSLIEKGAEQGCCQPDK